MILCGPGFSQRIISVVTHLHRLLYVGHRILRLYVMEMEHFLNDFWSKPCTNRPVS